MNSLNKDLAGKVVVLYTAYIKGEVVDRTFRCKSGFGCKSFTMGGAIGGTFLKDGESTRVEGFMVERLATDKEITEAEAAHREFLGKKSLLTDE